MNGECRNDLILEHFKRIKNAFKTAMTGEWLLMQSKLGMSLMVAITSGDNLISHYDFPVTHFDCNRSCFAFSRKTDDTSYRVYVIDFESMKPIRSVDSTLEITNLWLNEKTLVCRTEDESFVLEIETGKQTLYKNDLVLTEDCFLREGMDVILHGGEKVYSTVFAQAFKVFYGKIHVLTRQYHTIIDF